VVFVSRARESGFACEQHGATQLFTFGLTTFPVDSSSLMATLCLHAAHSASDGREKGMCKYGGIVPGRMVSDERRVRLSVVSFFLATLTHV
jgi:hypothetical protein